MLCYVRYVDDTLTIMPDKLSADNFLVTLNNCHSSLKFTMEIENDGMLPFLGIQLLNKSTQIQTKTYVKPTNTGLLLHYKSHVDDRYKRGLLKTMFDRAFRLSSNWSYFSEECHRLKIVFSRLDYPDKLVNSSITRFIADKASDQPTSRLPTDEPHIPTPSTGERIPDSDRVLLDIAKKKTLHSGGCR